ncbi:MAG: hypothetical protein AB1798_19260 [Spirochaetota bacterium]
MKTLLITFCLITAGCSSQTIFLGPITPIRPMNAPDQRKILRLQSVNVAPPILKIQAVDQSFTLSDQPYNGSPFYLNDDENTPISEFPPGPLTMKHIENQKWIEKNLTGRKDVLIFLSTRQEPLYGKLAIFPAKDAHHTNKNVTVTITIDNKSIDQTKQHSAGVATGAYKHFPTTWVQWALWFSEKPQ